MSEQPAIEYVERALAFREEFPDALDALQRGQLGPWLDNLNATRLDKFLATFPPLLALADEVALGTRHHMNARAVWRLLTCGGEVRNHFDRQLVDGVQLDIEKGSPLDRWKRFTDALQAAGYFLPDGLTFGKAADSAYHRFASRVIDFQREYDMELVFAHSNRYSSIFAMASPRYEQFMEGWLELIKLAHAFELPESAPGSIRSAFPKYGPQSELHSRWPDWLQRAADDIRGNVDLAIREVAGERERQNRLDEARLAYLRLAAFLDALRSSDLADISLTQLGITDLGKYFNHTKGNDHG